MTKTTKISENLYNIIINEFRLKKEELKNVKATHALNYCAFEWDADGKGDKLIIRTNHLIPFIVPICCKTDCKYVAKFFDYNDYGKKGIDAEIILTEKMSAIGVGPKVYDKIFIEAENQPNKILLLVMQKLDITLREYIEKGGILTKEVQFKIYKQLLNYYKATGTPYADLHDNNIMFDFDKNVFLIDYGDEGYSIAKYSFMNFICSINMLFLNMKSRNIPYNESELVKTTGKVKDIIENNYNEISRMRNTLQINNVIKMIGNLEWFYINSKNKLKNIYDPFTFIEKDGILWNIYEVYSYIDEHKISHNIVNGCFIDTPIEVFETVKAYDLTSKILAFINKTFPY